METDKEKMIKKQKDKDLRRFRGNTLTKWQRDFYEGICFAFAVLVCVGMGILAIKSEVVATLIVILFLFGVLDELLKRLIPRYKVWSEGK